jgi:hypothetical protein
VAIRDSRVNSARVALIRRIRRVTRRNDESAPAPALGRGSTQLQGPLLVASCPDRSAWLPRVAWRPRPSDRAGGEAASALRILQGIHFRRADEGGVEIGKGVTNYVNSHLFTTVGGG